MAYTVNTIKHKERESDKTLSSKVTNIEEDLLFGDFIYNNQILYVRYE